MFAEVIVDILNSETDKVFDYIIPDNLKLIEGTRVLVPFGNRKIEGYVIKIKSDSSVSKEKLKEVIKPIDNYAAILPEMLKLKDFMTRRYNLRVADTLRLFIPSEMRSGKVKPIFKTYCKLNENFNLEEFALTLKKNAVKQMELVLFLREHKIADFTLLNKDFGAQAVKKFIDLGILTTFQEEITRSPDVLNHAKEHFVHTPEQERAITGVKLNENCTYLIHGVTGSGKTEVYMTLIENVLKNGKSAIMLVPEISLTPQIMYNFKNRFGENVALLHSGLSAGERYDEWRRLRNGKAKVAVGARSAIFAPLENVGIIIIDEEHDSSYSSESNPRYKTVEVADFRTRYNSCPLVLGSATPSIASYYYSQIGKYKLLELPTRANGKDMPKIQIVDMLSEIRNGNNGIFSVALRDELAACMRDKKQAMLFLNRRGYTSFMMCRKCGYVAKCTDCDVSLVYHKVEDKLKCHYCGKRFKALTVCPECGSHEIRQGAIGTQRVVDELRELFPDVKILRMDNDTTKNKNSHQKILEEFSNSHPAILVGTQMIAKGHDFPDVTLVGIIDADQSLYQSDYRSPERAFALITQVSGRAGRKDLEGKVILQTYNPRHYVYKFASNYNYKAFYEKEINLRETTKFPPFTTIVRVLVSSENEEIAKSAIRSIYNELADVYNNFRNDFYYFNAMKSPVGRIKNKTRYQILMRFTKLKESDIMEKIYSVADSHKSAKLSIFVEIDPQNLS
ncbi:MAG TPA: primosomal protein N' [Candidatus Caccopulliclostridium gallistercoris]|uniref:Replication restart protein PriA n=1 Tax=Candidatus Caccopulliclostridium gallistercoris TaxID=2840719 RepID=A0A9D1SYY2_9FIRM|nr:primosomal protein N' [Candidatus Caccopulliclostridium gallistercoris]